MGIHLLDQHGEYHNLSGVPRSGSSEMCSTGSHPPLLFPKFLDFYFACHLPSSLTQEMLMVVGVGDTAHFKTMRRLFSRLELEWGLQLQVLSPRASAITCQLFENVIFSPTNWKLEHLIHRAQGRIRHVSKWHAPSISAYSMPHYYIKRVF